MNLFKKIKLTVMRTLHLWIDASEFLPEPDEPVIVVSHGWKAKEHKDLYFGSLKPVKGCPDGSDNIWGIPTPGSEWTLWGWSYFKKPNVTYWRTLPRLPKGESYESSEKADD